MKKLFVFTLILIVTVSSFVTASALESGIEAFSITPIRPNQKDPFVYVNFTVSEVQPDATLLVAFYTNGTLTRLTPFDISEKVLFTNQKINAYIVALNSDGVKYRADQTPDEIKFFTWDKTTLAPKTLCDDVLNKEVIDAANKEVLDSLALVPEATEFIRKNRLISEEDFINGNYSDWDTHIYPILDYIDACAVSAEKDAENHLLTSLYAQSLYKGNIDEIRSNMRQTPTRQKNKLIELMSENNKIDGLSEEEMLNGIGIPKKYYKALENAGKFLDFSLTEK